MGYMEKNLGGKNIAIISNSLQVYNGYKFSSWIKLGIKEKGANLKDNIIWKNPISSNRIGTPHLI